MTITTLCVLFVTAVAFTTSGQLASGSSVCPTDYLHIAWGCAYQPHCFGDSGCGSGHKCCPHTCGAYCYDTSTAVSSHTSDGNCHTLSCLLGRKK